MDANFWFATISYLVVTFILAAGWHLVLFKKIYDQLGVFTRKNPIIPLGVSSMVLQALVLAWAFPFLYNSSEPISRAVYIGILIVGIFMGSGAVLGEAGKNEVGSIPKWIILESSYYIVSGASIGLVLGLIYK